MHESFLHYVWQMQYFNKANLQTVDGEKIEVFNPGTLNTNAGPDFLNARIRIGSIDWVGSVEIHIRASGWHDHHHEQDRAYDNVILHVVWQDDSSILRNDQTSLPTLVLRERVDESLIRRYRQLVTSALSIPCQRLLGGVDDVTRISMMDKVMAERLERKADAVTTLYEQNGRNWEETFYQLLAQNFGFKINAEPFFLLARLLPLKLLLKHADKPRQLEALLLGQAGFLEGRRGDPYFLELKREHQLLSGKYDLQDRKMSKAQWRFLRLRPANFPTLRLAQFAAVLHGKHGLFSRVVDCDDVKSIFGLFTPSIPEYWQHHYQFSAVSRTSIHQLGSASIENIIVNTIVPTWVAYARMTDNQPLMDRAIRVLQQLPGEVNRITRLWKDLGIPAHTSFDAQALIELNNNYCLKKSCLHCAIGASLMRPL